MLKITTLALSSALMLAGAAQAHEVWLERDGAGPARVYLGEPADPVPPNGDPEFPNLKAPVVFTADPAAPAALTRKADHIEAAVKTAGDVRAKDDNVFEPWKGQGDKMEGAAYYARAGRAETATKLDLEIAPVAANSDTFVVVWKGQPLADASVNIVNPDRWQKSFKTDAAGKVAVPTSLKGRYLLAVSHPVDGEATIAGKPVAKVYHTSTLTFVK
ncbi:DUF4198 domain-containing protein [Phenylobacterium sp. LjRoot164]|uniref:hypothetical protein n=1 Tax=unclassified Phenylobacterium TaxID=2640670 RepID=UPI003ED09EEF